MGASGPVHRLASGGARRLAALGAIGVVDSGVEGATAPSASLEPHSPIADERADAGFGGSASFGYQSGWLLVSRCGVLYAIVILAVLSSKISQFKLHYLTITSNLLLHVWSIKYK